MTKNATFPNLDFQMSQGSVCRVMTKMSPTYSFNALIIPIFQGFLAITRLQYSVYPARLSRTIVNLCMYLFSLWF